MDFAMWINGWLRIRCSLVTGFLVLASMFSNGIASVKIRHLRIPDPLENASAPAIILDCDYEYDQIDKDSLTVKWFFNDNHEAVYQWIPKTHSPQALGILSGRLDLSYRASEDMYTMHRALRIVNPTMELSGLYRCQVSSFQNEVERMDYLVIYSKADMVEINFTKPSPDRVNVSCQALGLYPKPDTKLIVYQGNTNNPRVIQDASVAVIPRKDGSYHVTVYHQFEDRHLLPETRFECVFSIQNANYKATDYITYSPGPPKPDIRHPLNPFLANQASYRDRHNVWNTSSVDHDHDRHQQELAQHATGLSEASDASSSTPANRFHSIFTSLLTVSWLCWHLIPSNYG